MNKGRAKVARPFVLESPHQLFGLGCALEQLAGGGLILRDARSGAKQHTKFDHRRRTSFLGRLALGAYRFRHLPVCCTGATKLIKGAAQ